MQMEKDTKKINSFCMTSKDMKDKELLELAKSMVMVMHNKTWLIYNKLLREGIKLGLIRIIKTYLQQLLKLRIIFRSIRETKIIRMKSGFVGSSILIKLVRNQRNQLSNKISRLILTYFKSNKKIQDLQLFNLMIRSGQLVVTILSLSNN